MEFNELIKARRSVRAYKEGANITEEEIKALVEQASLCPTWKNSQTARYYVACTPEAKEQVLACLPGFNQNSAKNASALVVTSFVRDTSGFTQGVADNELGNKWGAYDLGLNNAYFVLAATNAGYDTLIMGLRDAAAIRKIFNISKNEQITAVIALGVKEGETKCPRRMDVDDVLVIK